MACGEHRRDAGSAEHCMPVLVFVQNRDGGTVIGICHNSRHCGAYLATQDLRHPVEKGSIGVVQLNWKFVLADFLDAAHYMIDGVIRNRARTMTSWIGCF